MTLIINQYALLLFLLLVSLSLPSVVRSDAIRISICQRSLTDTSKQRVFFEHDSGDLSGTPDASLTLRTGLFRTRRYEYQASGYLNNVPASEISVDPQYGCVKALSRVRDCGSELVNDWVYFDVDFSDFCRKTLWLALTGSTDYPLAESCSSLYSSSVNLVTFPACTTAPPTPAPTPTMGPNRLRRHP
jgi:hypothetical protein